MTSAVYFSAKWLYAFQPAANEIFYKSTGEQKPVKMMTINKKFNYGKINNDAEWISIPYDSAESMVIILPSPRVSLDNLIRGLSHNDFVNITENIYKEETQANVDITMPTFSISSIVSLVQPFREVIIITIKLSLNSLIFDNHFIRWECLHCSLQTQTSRN